ncbi:hypothetical protein BaRGS_00027407, partial [Batillaria attramentaria]
RAAAALVSVVSGGLQLTGGQVGQDESEHDTLATTSLPQSPAHRPRPQPQHHQRRPNHPALPSAGTLRQWRGVPLASFPPPCFLHYDCSFLFALTASAVTQYGQRSGNCRIDRCTRIDKHEFSFIDRAIGSPRSSSASSRAGTWCMNNQYNAFEDRSFLTVGQWRWGVE